MATISGKPLGRIGLGVMSMAFAKLSNEQAAKAIKTAVDAGENVINAATFYGLPPDPDFSLKFLGAFFEAYPDYIDKTVLCVKGTVDLKGLPKHNYSGELEFLRKDLQFIQERLGRKKLDVYVITRQPHDVSLDTLLENLKILHKEGHFGAIGLSEVKASTLRRAHAIFPISMVENELSLFNIAEQDLEVVKACDELGISYHAYSPLGRGFLTDAYRGMDQLPADDIRNRFPRFQGENFKKNLQLVDKVRELSERKGFTAGQYGLAYIMQLSPQVIPLQGSSNPGRILENHRATEVKLTPEEIKEIETLLAGFKTSGARYPDIFANDLMK